MGVIDFYPRASAECELVMCMAEEAITNEEATSVCVRMITAVQKD